MSLILLLCLIQNPRTELKKVTVSDEKVEAIYEDSLAGTDFLSRVEWEQKNITIPSPQGTAFGAFRLIYQEIGWVVVNYRIDPPNVIEVYKCQ